MNVAVWDTYVQKKDGGIMHFDIIAPSEIKDEKRIHGMGKEYLKIKGQDGQSLTAKECRFCHQEVVEGEMLKSIENRGYYIIEMEGCD
ncbi:MAG: DUF2024 family protein [Chitinophagaceae bacterium]|nr:MAG: DUF2024 family protein [Chitinophagaceae bacterium]